MVSSLLYNLNHAALWRGEINVWDRRMTAASLDRLLYLGLHRSGWMGKSEAVLLRRLVRPGMRVLDVGANVGLYSLLMAELTGESGSVLAFEPEPNLYAMLAANCARNAARNVTAVPHALGSANGRVAFQRSCFNSGDNRLGENSAAHESVEVEVVRFDDFAPEAVLDFIKIDVQGHELEVLAGMERAIARSAKLRVLFEFCPSAVRRAGSRPEELLAFFLERNFCLFDISSGGPRPFTKPAVPAHRYINLLASRA